MDTVPGGLPVESRDLRAPVVAGDPRPGRDVGEDPRGKCREGPVKVDGSLRLLNLLEAKYRRRCEVVGVLRPGVQRLPFWVRTFRFRWSGYVVSIVPCRLGPELGSTSTFGYRTGGAVDGGVLV